MSDDDIALVAAAKADRQAFALLYRRYVGRVYGYCYVRLGEREAAEDATSTVFAKALVGLAACRDDAFRSWLFAIAHNVVTDVHRARRPLAPLAAARELVDPTPSPEEAALADHERRSVRALLAWLVPDQARVLELRLAGLTDAEIARVLGRSHGAIRSTQFRAVARLRALLGVDVAAAKEEHDGEG